MFPAPRLCLSLLLACLLTSPVVARLGETLPELTKRFGRPVSQTAKNNASWLFEVTDGPLLYSVTFGSDGRSVAEGLKPLRRALFSKKTAMDFIDTQLIAYRDSATLQVVPEGGKYRFAGQDFTRGQQEYVVVDEPNGILVVWSQGPEPAVMVLSPAMMPRAR